MKKSLGANMLSTFSALTTVLAGAYMGKEYHKLTQPDNTRVYQHVTVYPPVPVVRQQVMAQSVTPQKAEKRTQSLNYDKESLNILAKGANHPKMAAEGGFYRDYLNVTAQILARLQDSEAVMAEINPNAPGWESLTDDEKRDMVDLTVNGFHEAGGEELEGMCAVNESLRLRMRDNYQGRGTTIREQMASLAQYSWMGDSNVAKRLTTRTKANQASWAYSYKSAAYVRLGHRRATELGIITTDEARRCETTLAKIPDGKDYFNPNKVTPPWAKQKLAKTHKGVRIGNHLFPILKELLVDKSR